MCHILQAKINKNKKEDQQKDLEFHKEFSARFGNVFYMPNFARVQLLLPKGEPAVMLLHKFY